MEEQKVKVSLATTIFIMLLVCITIVGFIYLLYSLKNHDDNAQNNTIETTNILISNNTNQISNTVSNEIVE